MLNEGYYNIIESTDININIIDEVWANQWREQYANDSVDEILANNQRIDGIICSNDLLAQSAIRVLSEYKLADEIPVASQDAELSACQRIVEGTQLASVYKPINNLAKTTIDMIPIILSQKSIENVDYIDNGSNLTVYKKLDFELVTKENIEEIIIESGFHSKEDVYRYVGNQD
jgi:D-xylose transport system substrate-binding protein